VSYDAARSRSASDPDAESSAGRVKEPHSEALKVTRRSSSGPVHLHVSVPPCVQDLCVLLWVLISCSSFAVVLFPHGVAVVLIAPVPPPVRPRTRKVVLVFAENRPFLFASRMASRWASIRSCHDWSWLGNIGLTFALVGWLSQWSVALAAHLAGGQPAGCPSLPLGEPLGVKVGVADPVEQGLLGTGFAAQPYLFLFFCVTSLPQPLGFTQLLSSNRILPLVHTEDRSH